MYSDWTNNNGGEEVVVELTVDRDESLFIALDCSDLDLSLIIDNDRDAQQFFRAVDQVRTQWTERLKQEG